MRLVFPSHLIDNVRAAMAASALETCAIFFTHAGTGGRILVSEGAVVPDSAYQLRTAEAAKLGAEFVSEVVRQARWNNCGVVFAHSHPDEGEQPGFSQADDEGEAALDEYLRLRLPDRVHIALVVAKLGMTARRLATHQALRIEERGPQVRFAFAVEDDGASAYSQIFDRQVRAFGVAGQTILNRLRVGIVGLGGTGSIIALELAYLGVRNFLLIDPQPLDTTNRNRVVGSNPGDVGKTKVEIAKRQILEINPAAVVETDDSEKGVLDAACCEKLRTVDFIFACTDSHAPRAIVCKLCYQYLIPGIDVGVDISATNGAIKAITGRTQMMAPGLACLLCSGSINPEAIRRELMSPEQKAADPYFTGDGEPQPAVITLNGTMCSLAVTMFLAAVVGIPMKARYQRYDGLLGQVRPVVVSADRCCLFCSTSGVLGRGGSRSVTLS